MPEESVTNLQITVNDKTGVPQGKVKMDLNWVRNEWIIKEGDSSWDRVGYSRKGQFEHKDWGVIWIWDQAAGDKKKPGDPAQPASSSETTTETSKPEIKMDMYVKREERPRERRRRGNE